MGDIAHMAHPLIPELTRAGIIGTLRAPDADTALAAIDALVAGGIAAIEVTYTTPGAGEVIARARQRHGDGVLVGAGTIVSPDQAREAHAAGAAFLVSPGWDPDVVAAMQQTDALTMIGAFTPTEVMNLVRHDVDIVKFFPGSIGGPGALRALRGPFPTLDYIPTGGVSAANLAEWLAAGAIAVGAGSELIASDALVRRDAAALTRRAEEFVSALRAARGRL